MAQLLIRNLDDDVKSRLRERARRHGQSLDELARDILRDAAKEKESGRGLGSEIAALFRGKGLKEGDIQELRGYPVQPATFDE